MHKLQFGCSLLEYLYLYGYHILYNNKWYILCTPEKFMEERFFFL